MPTYDPGDRVGVRSSAGLDWHDGVVVSHDHGLTQCCYHVKLDTPVSGNAWSGTTRKLGGDELVSMVCVFRHTENLTPGEHIRPQAE
jgi:hypothetical protein